MHLDTETDLSLTRLLDCPRDILWECWTTPEHLMQFFVPKPHRVLSCEIDLRVGGRFDTVFEVDGNEMPNRGVYLEIVPKERLVFTDAYSEDWKPSPEPFMTALILFEDADGDATRYTAIARHRTADTRKSHEEMGFHDGWSTVALQLEAYGRALAESRK